MEGDTTRATTAPADQKMIAKVSDEDIPNVFAVILTDLFRLVTDAARRKSGVSQQQRGALSAPNPGLSAFLLQSQRGGLVEGQQGMSLSILP